MYFNVTTSSEGIEKKLKKEIVRQLNAKVVAGLPKLEQQIREFVHHRLITSDGYQGIASSDFSADFGFEAGSEQQRVNAIVNEIVQNINVIYHPYKLSVNNITGGIDVHLIVEDYSDVLGLSEATIVTEGGYSLPWLEWTLTAGNNIIVDGYDVVFGNFPTSRSQEAVMIPIGAWKVPDSISGTQDNNWITRAILGNNGTGTEFTNFFNLAVKRLIEV